MPRRPRPELRQEVYWKWVGHCCLPFRYDLEGWKLKPKRGQPRQKVRRRVTRGFLNKFNPKKAFLRRVVRKLGKTLQWNKLRKHYQNQNVRPYNAAYMALHDISEQFRYESAFEIETEEFEFE